MTHGPQRIDVVTPCLILGKLGCARTQLVCTHQASRLKLGLGKAATLRLPPRVANQRILCTFSSFRTRLFFPCVRAVAPGHGCAAGEPLCTECPHPCSIQHPPVHPPSVPPSPGAGCAWLRPPRSLEHGARQRHSRGDGSPWMRCGDGCWQEEPGQPELQCPSQHIPGWEALGASKGCTSSI